MNHTFIERTFRFRIGLLESNQSVIKYCRDHIVEILGIRVRVEGG